MERTEPDWSIITPRIACGGALGGDDVCGLLRYGYTHVLDLRHTSPDERYLRDFVYHWNPARDDGREKSVRWFEESINFAMGCLLVPNQRLYVGCHQGNSRAPSVVYAILMALGIPSSLAYNLIIDNRMGVGIRYAVDAERAVKELGYA